MLLDKETHPNQTIIYCYKIEVNKTLAKSLMLMQVLSKYYNYS